MPVVSTETMLTLRRVNKQNQVRKEGARGDPEHTQGRRCLSKAGEEGG